MKTLSAAATLATERPYATPIFLAEITFTVPSSLTLYLADRAVTMGGQDYLPFVVDWGTLESTLNVLDVDGRPATATVLFNNTTPIAGRDRLSDLIRTTFNPGGYEWAFAACTIRQGFDGLTDAADLATLGVFYLEDPTDIGEDRLAVRMSDQGLVIDTALAVTRVNREEFPRCNLAEVGRSIPIPFGTMRGVPAVQVVDSAQDRLDGGITASATSLTLQDATDFPSGAVTMQIDSEQVTGTKSGNSFVSLSRANNGTSAAAHPHGTPVYEVRAGTAAYRFAVGEHVGDFKIRSISNVTIDDEPPTSTAVSIVLEDTTIVPGKNFAMIDMNGLAKFFVEAPTTAERDVSVTTLGSVLNGNVGSPTSPMERTIAPSCTGGTTSTVRSLNGRVQRAGNKTGIVYWQVARRLSGGSNVIVATGTYANEVGGDQSFSDSKTYASTSNEIVSLIFSGGEWNDGELYLYFDNYHVEDSTTTVQGGGPVTIGTVRCDVEGIQDDDDGTISGTPALLLENPADITRLILTELYDIPSASLGTTWATTRTRLAGLAYAWAFPLDYDTFANLRRQLGEQARAALYLEAGLWEFQFLDDAPSAGLTLDYPRDIWDGEPALLTRTPRVDVRNRLTVNSRIDFVTGDYRRRVTLEDLTQIPTAQAGELLLPWVQDETTAANLGAYWLSIWGRQRFSVALTAWWNLLPVTKIDYFRVQSHPILEAHGDDALVFRVVRRDDRIADGRVALHGVEVALLPVPRDPEEDEDMVCNCRLTYVSTTQIRLDPWQGNQIRIKTGSGWQVGTVPSAGVTKDTTGLSASTLYYVYAYDSSGTLTLELSTTAYSVDTVTGLAIKTGDDTRLLVGLVRTNASTQFADSATQRFCLTWFNRHHRHATNTFSADRTTTSTSFVELNTEIRIEFLAWSDEAVYAGASGGLANNTLGNTNQSGLAFDGTTPTSTSGAVSYTGATATNLGTLAGAVVTTLTEGYHYLTLVGRVSAGTGTWFGTDASNTAKCRLWLDLRG